MAALTPSDKVKDKEYANWLKVTLALYHMKLGLHTFIKNEIDCLHQSLIQKIYGGPTIPPSLPPCTTCLASHVNRNKHTGVWEFRKQCKSYCGVWLYELLLLHTNPKSEKIYWDNSIVTAWRSNPWECAKVFMPRGQPSSNTGPAECDAQALLTLLANCKHFLPKLSSQGQGIRNTISVIRNRIMHDGEMKLSDADRMNYIQHIIQFLEDPVHLKSMLDCQLSVINIRKIDTDSLDIIFNLDDEITALRTAVNEFQLELGMKVEKALNTAESLKEEYKELNEQLTKRVDDFEKELELHGTRMDTIESNVQQQVPRLDAVEENVHSFDTKLKEFKTSTDTVLQQQEKKQQEMDTALTQLSASAALHEGKLDKVEEMMQANNFTQWGNNSGREGEVDGEGRSDCGISGAPKKIRPESDGLRQLKNQTEDKLDTLRRLKYISTTQAKEARKLLERNRSVVIKGNPGEGKTTTALRLIDNEMYRDRRVVLYCPRHWEKVDTDWVYIVIVEDIFGQFDLDRGHLQEWMVHLRTIQEHVDVGKLQVIITTRVDIMSKASSMIGSLQLFSNDFSLTLSSKQLNHSEKMDILNRELLRYTKIHKKNMDVDEKEKCITNFRGLIGFPQCCSLFAGDHKLFDKGPEFFKSPEKFFVANISLLEDTRFLSLAFLFCNGTIIEEYLSSETMPEPSKYLLMQLASCLEISKKKSPITLVRDSYNSFLGLYVEKLMSSQFGFKFKDKDAKPSICFSHPTVCEAVGQVLWDRCPEMVVTHGDPEYLYQRTYTAEVEDSISQNIYIPVYLYGLLAERMVHDIVDGGLARSVVKHSALKQHDFLMKLKEDLHKGNKIKDFFMAKPYSMSLSSHDYSFMRCKDEVRLFKGECVTFLQYILQSEEDLVRLVYSQFLEFLACEHKTKSSNCWLCEEKQNLLDLALYYHHFQIADKLITMNACYTHVSLCNAARHGDLRRVQTIIETLKCIKVFNPECQEAKYALCRAYISGKQILIKFLLKESVTLDIIHVEYVVQHGDLNVLMKVVQHLKSHNNWGPHQDGLRKDIRLYYVYKYIYFKILFKTYHNEKFDMVDYLLKNGLKVSRNILFDVSLGSSQHVVARVIQDLKVTNSWDPSCDHASTALINAYLRQKYDLCDLLVQEGVSLSMKNLPDVVYSVSLETVTKAIQHLKDKGNWDPKCGDAYKALENAFLHHTYDVFDQLIQEGVLRMKALSDVVCSVPLESVKKAIKYLKDTDNWDLECNGASKALEKVYRYQKYDVCDLLLQERVLLSMKNLPGVVNSVSLESVKKAIQHLKDNDNWDPKCEDASKALEQVIRHQRYDVCDLLLQDGVTLTMKNLPDVVYSVSLESVKEAIQRLKDTDIWEPKCGDASEALKNAFRHQRYDVCYLLAHEGVSLTMKNLPDMVRSASLESVKKAVQHLKDTDNWDPKCVDASKALKSSWHQNYVVCDLLVREGLSVTIKNLPDVIYGISLESVKKAIQDLKDSGDWIPKCDDAYEAYENAFCHQKHDVCDLLVQEGVSIPMKNFSDVV